MEEHLSNLIVLIPSLNIQKNNLIQKNLKNQKHYCCCVRKKMLLKILSFNFFMVFVKAKQYQNQFAVSISKNHNLNNKKLAFIERLMQMILNKSYKRMEEFFPRLKKYFYIMIINMNTICLEYFQKIISLLNQIIVLINFQINYQN
ncbi:hypothetical protein TTHERM_000469288 (macronuclear) [Tetrahymena thermophila SB210]|uniref:Uncharacterized protein n=1 Tax=Tetrahymena thermophila (strain SB210) TaxID=312017 RepID=W7XFZ0_TETTS|nr:hypothetical protein TTHERM_000469288 [Tetrahymena thermophila SB210]EWS71764.1 hypothetical protein TTHERM_000469288 [Tetrahymena thermophila SB210]|eukprot:XP_012655717.1 hypothetical protein TTHERM_000469288 [Tetrahymena thermophila SB210]